VDQQFDSIPSCSSSASAPSQPASANCFLGGSQPQFSSLDGGGTIDDPVPRKRSFSSGSKFEQLVHHQQQQQLLQSGSGGTRRCFFLGVLL
jgi:hypothetical protein